MLFSSYLYALSYAKGSFRMFLTFVTGRHGGDGYVILGWLIFISIFMSCRGDMDFIWTWTKIWTLLDRIPMIYSISNVFDFNIRLRNQIVLLYFWHQTSWCYLWENARRKFQWIEDIADLKRTWPKWLNDEFWNSSLRTLKNKKYRTLNQNKSYLN